MPRKKKPTEQNADLAAEQKADSYAGQAKPEIAHVPHSVIALSVLISALGALAFGAGTSYKIWWLILIGILVTVGGSAKYLIAARQAENLSFNWNGVRLAATWFAFVAILLSVGFFLFKTITSAFSAPPSGDAIKTIIDPAPRLSPTLTATPTLTPSPTPSPSQELYVNDGKIRVLSDGRMLADVAPEYFESLPADLTTAQGIKKWNSYLDKWIMFSGTVRDVLIRRREKDTLVFLNREKGSQAAFFTDPKQREAVELLRKNDSITVVCKIIKATNGEFAFWHCELAN